LIRYPFAPLLIGTAAATIALPAAAQPLTVTAETSQDLSQLSIEELAQLNVRSASKRDEPLSAAPTALYVITGEEILASAATSLPEALRLAPNLNVQRVDARQYAISARGFNGIQSGNKLLALIDGRTIYTPLAATIFWELHNRPLEDIDQIEVISGPGGTLYGPNAVNGVISVVTRDARDTLGGLVRVTVGDRERTLVARFGGALGTGGAIRAYFSGYDREDLPPGVGPDVADRHRGWQAGFRVDSQSGASQFTVQGDLFRTDVPALPGDRETGHNLIARWTRSFADSSLQVQAYYDHFERKILLVRDVLQTFDLEVQYNRTIGVHDLVIGGGLRTTRDEFINNLNPFRLDPPSRRLWVFNLFAQDRIALADSLALIAGIKLENTSFTGIELLPSVRVAWQPTGRDLLWGAVSRAIRSPSRIDRQLVNPPLLEEALDFNSENLIAFEAGYRGQPTDTTSLSVSLFYNLYDGIRSTEFSPGFALPIRLRNGYDGETWGFEAWGSAQLMPWWRLNLGLAALWTDLRLEPGRVDLSQGDALGDDPEFQLLARSEFNLAEGLALNVGLRWVGGIDTQPAIPAYVEADARLAWHVADRLELFVAGENLLHRTHAESNDAGRAQLVERSVHAGTRVRF